MAKQDGKVVRPAPKSPAHRGSQTWVGKDKTIHFVSGLPRAGSTLFINILAQNHKFDVTPTSGILGMLVMLRNQWENRPEFKASYDENLKVAALKGLLNGYFHNSRFPVVFDKSRGWPAQVEMAERLLQRRVKILCPVRDVRDVLTSFEKLYRKNKDIRPIPGEMEHPGRFQTVAGRCEVWCGSDQPLGAAFNLIRDAMKRGFRDRIHFVEFEKLTTSPKTTMGKVYEFLDEDPFEHDFNKVEQYTQEDDIWHGYKDLHTIRPKVEPMEPQWPDILGKDVADVYKGKATNFWQE
jgi:sulfotransferase